MSIAARLMNTRWLMRAPIGLYRMRLGWLLGRRFLLLEHRGRTSGEARYVVLEVVWREASTELVIASAFGVKAQWFQNLVAEPRCRVSTGFMRRMPAVATVLTAAEGERFLSQYRRKYPRTWNTLIVLVRAVTGDADPQIPLVRLRLSGRADQGRRSPAAGRRRPRTWRGGNKPARPCTMPG